MKTLLMGALSGLSAILLALTLSFPASAADQSLLAKTGSTPRFRISVCVIDNLPYAVLQRVDGTPVCGPVLITIFPNDNTAFFSCDVGQRRILMTIVVLQGAVTFTATDDLGRMVQGTICPG